MDNRGRPWQLIGGRRETSVIQTEQLMTASMDTVTEIVAQAGEGATGCVRGNDIMEWAVEEGKWGTDFWF